MGIVPVVGRNPSLTSINKYVDLQIGLTITHPLRKRIRCEVLSWRTGSDTRRKGERKRRRTEVVKVSVTSKTSRVVHNAVKFHEARMLANLARAKSELRLAAIQSRNGRTHVIVVVGATLLMVVVGPVVQSLEKTPEYQRAC